MADHAPEPSSNELYVKFRDRARQPAKGVIQGPDLGWRPSKRTIKPQDERERANYLVHATNSRVPEFTGERGGDGSRTKFTRGFHRRQGLGAEQARERAARESALEARKEAHDAKRRDVVAKSAYKNGCDVVTSAPPAADESRGRLFLDHKPTTGMVKEGERAMRDSDMRFHRVSAAARSADAVRAKRLGSDGLPEAPRCSSVIGYGRADMPSYGIRDALDKSEYVDPGVVRARAEAVEAENAARAAAEAAAPALPAAMMAKDRVGGSVRIKPGEREPDRVFGAGEATIAPAMPDDEKRMIRLDREIAKAVGSRPADRPKSLLINAARLEYQRERRKLAAEIDLVRALP